jgi:hypothetical protein
VTVSRRGSWHVASADVVPAVSSAAARQEWQRLQRNSGGGGVSQAAATPCCHRSSRRREATWFFTVGSAPARSSSRTTRTCPPELARCSAVLPACSGRVLLVSAQMSRSAILRGGDRGTLYIRTLSPLPGAAYSLQPARWLLRELQRNSSGPASTPTLVWKTHTSPVALVCSAATLAAMLPVAVLDLSGPLHTVAS